MRLVGSHDGIGIALFEDLSVALYRDALKEVPFVPSPYCNPDIKEHRRVEVCKDLKADPLYQTVGICKHTGCNGKKYYEHIVAKMNNQIVIQGQSSIRRY
jgi:hypothetical protein